MRELLDTAEGFHYSAFAKWCHVADGDRDAAPLDEPASEHSHESAEPHCDEHRCKAEGVLRTDGLRGDGDGLDLGCSGERLAHLVDRKVGAGSGQVCRSGTGKMTAGCDEQREGNKELRRRRHPKPIAGAGRVLAQGQSQQRDNEGEQGGLPEVIAEFAGGRVTRLWTRLESLRFVLSL